LEFLTNFLNLGKSFKDFPKDLNKYFFFNSIRGEKRGMMETGFPAYQKFTEKIF